MELNLFDEDNAEKKQFEPAREDIAVISALHSGVQPELSSLPPNARRLYNLSSNAFDTIIHAWMSELPITAEIIRFGLKILAANSRKAAEITAADRGDSDTRAVMEAAYKVHHEIHRLMGLLRFCPNEDSVYIARCEPDHFILPALGPYFRDRFGETPWAIIDEKRRLCLRCSTGTLELFNMDDDSAPLENNTGEGEWEKLWRHYHKTINNESRNNPDLQRQFMPKRYWKHITEKQ